MQIVNVADIKVKEGITKTGPKAGKPWELIIIIGDDNSEFTTFDKSAKEVGIGGVLELEPVIKAGKTNFTKFTIKKKGQAPAPVATSGGGDSLEKRQSIESQTRAYIIADLYKAEKLEAGSSQVKSLLVWLDKLGSPAKKPEAPKPEATKSTRSPVAEESNRLPEEQNAIDSDWLKETLKIIHWSETTAKSWIKFQFGVPAEGSLLEVVNSLDKDELKKFYDHIKEMREASSETG